MMMMMSMKMRIMMIFLPSLEYVILSMRVGNKFHNLVIFIDLTSLVQTVFGNNTFPNTTSISFVELPSVEDITMEEGSLGKTSELTIDSKK